MKNLRTKKGFICDMDGVIYHGNNLLSGVKEFVNWLYENNKSFLFLTNSSERSSAELRQKLYSNVISEISKKFAGIYGVGFLDIDFKKKNGFKRSIELSKEYDGRVFLVLDRAQPGLGVVKCGGKCCGVALIRRVYHCRNNGSRLQITPQASLKAAYPVQRAAVHLQKYHKDACREYAISPVSHLLLRYSVK